MFGFFANASSIFLHVHRAVHANVLPGHCEHYGSNQTAQFPSSSPRVVFRTVPGRARLTGGPIAAVSGARRILYLCEEDKIASFITSALQTVVSL